jgi:predicted metal-dependent HD superfamily phosphohydrolase
VTTLDLSRWNRACAAIGVQPQERKYRRVCRAWRSMGRHYHTLDHLDACLRELDDAWQLAERPAEVELALWFHDAVYRTWRKDNEARSAGLAARCLGAAPADCVERIRRMILATVHSAEALQGDVALVVDVDLSILGQPADSYAAFERAIRREYWWVPRARYVAGRGGILKSFLQRETIYRHARFREKYEQPARANLERALEQLAG